jgi:hypothetical protein
MSRGALLLARSRSALLVTCFSPAVMNAVGADPKERPAFES